MKKMITLLLALCLVLSMAACTSNPGQTAVDGAKAINVGYAVHNLSEEYCKTLSDSIKATIEAAGGTYNVYDAGGGASTQVNQFEDMISNGVDVIIFTPADSSALGAVLQSAKDAGIFLIAVDSGVADEDKDLLDCTILSNNYECGVLIGQDILARFPNENVECMFGNVPQVEAINTRFQGIYDTIAGHDNIVVYEKMPANGFAGIPNDTEDILQAHPSVRIFVGLNDTAAMAMHATAISANVDAISYGIDGSPAGKQAIQSGDLTCTIAQSPINLGKTAAEIALNLFEGKTVDKDIAVPVIMIDASNISEFDLYSWS